jgi:hypothetical protein
VAHLESRSDDAAFGIGRAGDDTSRAAGGRSGEGGASRGSTRGGDPYSYSVWGSGAGHVPTPLVSRASYSLHLRRSLHAFDLVSSSSSIVARASTLS